MGLKVGNFYFSPFSPPIPILNNPIIGIGELSNEPKLCKQLLLHDTTTFISPRTSSGNLNGGGGTQYLSIGGCDDLAESRLVG